MECRFCGKKIKKDSNVCDYCGKEVTEGLGTDELIDAMPELHDEFDNISKMQAKDKKKKARKENREKNKGKRWRVAIAISLVVVIVAGVVVGMLYLKGKNAEPEEVAPTTSAIDGGVVTTFRDGSFTDILITDEITAKEALKAGQETLGFIDAEEEYELDKKIEFGDMAYYRFRQMYQGIPVYGGEIVIAARKSGEAVAFNGSYVTTKGLTAKQTINKATAGNAIVGYVNKMPDDYAVVQGVNMTDVQKVVVNTDEKTYLAYMANVSGYNRLDEYNAFDVFVDAVGGNGIGAIATSSFENKTSVKTTVKANAKTDVKTTVEEVTDETIQEESQAGLEENYIYELATVNDKFKWNDESNTTAEEKLLIADIEAGNTSPYITSVKTAVDRAYYFFDGTYGYKGLDGQGGKFKVYVNSNEYISDKIPTGSALYNNGKLMFFREDLTQGEIDYNSVVHEYAHGVMQHIAGLSGTKELNENAAIAEGLADVFAELAEIKQNGSADWMHGERNLRSPGDGYYTYASDDIVISDIKDCYAYSTIVSHMASYMYDGIQNADVLCEYWFNVLNLTTKHTNFQELNSIMQVVAESMYGAGRLDENGMKTVVVGVGILTRAQSPQSEPAGVGVVE